MEPREVKDDLVQDMIEVLTSFCVRLYGRRSAKNQAKKAMEAIENAGEFFAGRRGDEPVRSLLYLLALGGSLHSGFDAYRTGSGLTPIPARSGKGPFHWSLQPAGLFLPKRNGC